MYNYNNTYNGVRYNNPGLMFEAMTKDDKVHYLNEQYIDAFHEYEDLNYYAEDIGHNITVTITDFITWGDLFNKHTVHILNDGISTIACPSVVSRECCEGDDEEVSFLKVIGEHDKEFWICASCLSKATFRNRTEINSLYMDDPVPKLKYSMIDCMDPAYLIHLGELSCKGLIA